MDEDEELSGEYRHSILAAFISFLIWFYIIIFSEDNNIGDMFANALYFSLLFIIVLVVTGLIIKSIDRRRD